AAEQQPLGGEPGAGKQESRRVAQNYASVTLERRPLNFSLNGQKEGTAVGRPEESVDSFAARKQSRFKRVEIANESAERPTRIHRGKRQMRSIGRQCERLPADTGF